MRKFVSVLMRSRHSPAKAAKPGNAAFLVWLAIAIALIAYLSPWLVNPGVSLSLNAYDLAEWSSLHPTVRGNTPILLTTLLLRLPLVCMALIVALSTTGPVIRREQWLAAMFVIGTAIALLPPLELFGQATGDLNYRQQFMLALCAFFGGLVGLSGLATKFHKPTRFMLALLGAAASVAGTMHSFDLMQRLNLPAQVGLGAIVATAILIAIAVLDVGESQRIVPRIKQGSSRSATTLF